MSQQICLAQQALEKYATRTQWLDNITRIWSRQAHTQNISGGCKGYLLLYSAEICFLFQWIFCSFSLFHVKCHHKAFTTGNWALHFGGKNEVTDIERACAETAKLLQSTKLPSDTPILCTKCYTDPWYKDETDVLKSWLDIWSWTDVFDSTWIYLIRCCEFYTWCCSVFVFQFSHLWLHPTPICSSHQMYDGPRQRFPTAIRPQRWIVNMKGNVTYYLSTVQRFRTNLLSKEKYRQFSHDAVGNFSAWLRMARKMSHTWTFWSRCWKDTLVFTSQPWMWLIIQLSSDGFMNK